MSIIPETVHEEDMYEENTDFMEESFNEFYYLDSPIIIDNFNVRKIACGQDNTMVLTKDHKLYVFGSNNYYQLGVLKSRNIYSPMSFHNIIKTQQENPAVDLKSNIIIECTFESLEQVETRKFKSSLLER